MRSDSYKLSRSKGVFLSAEWRHLVMLNYEVEASLLSPYIPLGTSLDSFQGRTNCLGVFLFRSTTSSMKQTCASTFVTGKAAKAEGELSSSPKLCPDARLR